MLEQFFVPLADCIPPTLPLSYLRVSFSVSFGPSTRCWAPIHATVHIGNSTPSCEIKMRTPPSGLQCPCERDSYVYTRWCSWTVDLIRLGVRVTFLPSDIGVRHRSDDSSMAIALGNQLALLCCTISVSLLTLDAHVVDRLATALWQCYTHDFGVQKCAGNPFICFYFRNSRRQPCS